MQFKILSAQTDKALQEILVSDEGLDMLENIGFREVPHKTTVTAKADILR